jgi:hypothetical protein
MKSLPSRLEILETVPTSSDAEILRLFTEPWANGDYEGITEARWRPGQPAIELARCAWLHYVATDDSLPFDFGGFIKVFVDGIDPEFL